MTSPMDKHEGLRHIQGAVHLLRKAIHASDPRNELDLRCHDIWSDLEKAIASLPSPELPAGGREHPVSCATCRFYSSEGGTCRAAPPVRLPRKFDPEANAGCRIRDETLLWGWPAVHAQDWCGDFDRAATPAAPPQHERKDKE